MSLGPEFLVREVILQGPTACSAANIDGENRENNQRRGLPRGRHDPLRGQERTPMEFAVWTGQGAT
jgi:hypothetical protein